MDLIKVVMAPKTEEKQSKPDQGEKATKLYEELKEEVLQKYPQGRFEKPGKKLYHTKVDPTVTSSTN